MPRKKGAAWNKPSFLIVPAKQESFGVLTLLPKILWPSNHTLWWEKEFLHKLCLRNGLTVKDMIVTYRVPVSLESV